MNTFNKKSLCVALAATGLLGVGGVAQAVNLSEDGTGMVLVYPYYTVRTAGTSTNAANTYINITNTTASTKAVKIRFREGKNSREVLDFNIFLSPVDMWTGAVVPTADGAALVTADRSCTIPGFTFADNTVGTVSSQVAFRNDAYKGDGGGDTLDRTREGYVEVFEMATYSTGSTGTVAASALHNQSTGLPASCATITDALASTQGELPTGGLMGSLQLINPGGGASMSVNATALDNFYNPGLPPTAANMYFPTGILAPSMANAGTTSAVKSGTTLTVTTGWATDSADAASAVLMHDSILNEFFSDPAALSLTDWVVTFPTKSHYADPSNVAAVRAPFQRIWSTSGPLVGTACDDVSFGVRDREELIRAGSVVGTDFSPPQAGPLVNTPTLCYEANVVTFNGSNVLGSKNSSLNIITTVGAAPGAQAKNGWASIIFDRFGLVGGPGVLVGGNTVQTPLATGVSGLPNPTSTYTGLPVVGFNVWKYTNSALVVGGVTSNVPTNYGMGVPHKSRTAITTP